MVGRIVLISFCSILMLSVQSCKEEDKIDLPVVTTAPASVLGDQSAGLSGQVAYSEKGNITARGFYWGTSPGISASNYKINSGSGYGTFADTLSGLEGGTTYYYRAFATNETGEQLGEEQSFTTELLYGFSYFGATIYAQPYDIPQYFPWGPLEQFVGALSNGSGMTNTIDISVNSGVYAAIKCHELVAFGHDDWYLPAINELQYLYDNRNLWDNFGDFAYWSSTEVSADLAKAIHFGTGEVIELQKNSQSKCRCIRKDQ